VAQKWLAKHELPDTYVDQIVEFIDKNTSGVALGGPAAGADPFTGSASYRPGNSQNANPSNVGTDPFTGAGSYRPSGAPPAAGKSFRLALKIFCAM
jgi:phospholipase A-2-activating protein